MASETLAITPLLSSSSSPPQSSSSSPQSSSSSPQSSSSPPQSSSSPPPSSSSPSQSSSSSPQSSSSSPQSSSSPPQSSSSPPQSSSSSPQSSSSSSQSSSSSPQSSSSSSMSSSYSPQSSSSSPQSSSSSSQSSSSSSSSSREDFVIRRLWELHKSPRDHINGILGSPRDFSVFKKMIDQGTLRSDFRFRGFPSYSMQSPRQPIIPGLSDDKRRSEENFMRVFGRSSIFDPAQPASEEIHRERKYYQPPFETDIPQRPRGIRDPFNEKTSAEVRKLKQMEMDAEQDILNMKQQKLAQDFRREEEKKRDYELLSKYYPWDRFNRGHGAPKADNDNRRRKFLETELSPRDTFTYRKEAGNSSKGHDLFIDTLGGPGGTVVRQNGAPGLQSMPDPRVGAFRSPGQGFPVQHERRLDLAIEEKKIAEQEQRIKELKKELEYLKSPRDQQLPHKPGDPRFGGGSDEMFSQGSKGDIFSKSNPYSKMANQFADFDPPRKEERRSLDLDSSRGGAGAPLRNDQGKPITRLPITMVRDDSGASKIREQIPGKQYTLPDEDNPVYFPFGMPGGGAPVRDRRGNVITNTFGNFEKKKDSADQRKYARAKEVLLQDLKVGIEEQHRKQEEDKRDLQAPFGELAELVRAGQVGKPRRDPITGSLANQHLGISDVSKLNTDRRGGNGAQKMNYQPKEISEKKIYYDELTQLAEERERARQLEKLREKQESNRHFDVFDHKWGALGGGAPKDRLVRKKVNLDNALFHQGNESRSEADLQRSHESHYGLEMTAQPQSVSSNQKRLFDDDICQSNDVTPRFVKNTVKSNSRNMYEYSLERASKPVSTGPPYATQGAYY